MFSDRENKIIKIIGKRSLTLKGIANKLFKGESRLEANILVSNSVNRIIRKCVHHKLSWSLEKNRTGRELIINKKPSK